MSHDIVLLDPVELTEVSRRELEEAGTVRVVRVSRQEDLAEAIQGADAVLFQLSPFQLSKAVLMKCRRLKVIGRIGAGTDQVDLSAAAEREITVVNGAGAQAAAVADHAMALMLCLIRNIVPAHNSVQAEGQGPPQPFMGRDLGGLVLGIIGFGACGRALAARALAFGMMVRAFDPHLPPEDIERAGVIPCGFDGLLAESDMISIHAPLTDSTRRMIGAGELAAMKTEAYLINTARGAIVDEAALSAALRDGKIAGAGLDVFEDEPLPSNSALIGLDQVVLTPHIAGWTLEAQNRAQEMVVSDAVRVLRGEAPHNPAAPPQAAAAPSAALRRTPGGKARSEPPPMLPYREWSGSGLPHPNDTHPFGVLPGMRSIIEAEGPLTAERAYKLYVRGTGYKRVTRAVQDKLDTVIDRLLKQKEIEIDLLDNQIEEEAQRVVRMKGVRPVALRHIGTREMYEVPLNEVAYLIKHRMDQRPTSSHDDLMRYVLNIYGWKRLTEKVRSYLTSAISIMYEMPDESEPPPASAPADPAPAEDPAWWEI